MTEYIYLKGKAKWGRLSSADPWGNYKVTLYPNKEALDQIFELQKKGLKNTLRKDDDGYNITFRRPTQKTIRGRVVGFASPLVFKEDGETPLKEALIGNGSDITIKLCIYDFMTPNKVKGIAARLESVRVDNLVAYVSGRDFEGDEREQQKGLPEQSPQ